MHRRWTICLTVGLICGGLGCTHQQTVPGTTDQRLASNSSATLAPPPAPEPRVNVGSDKDNTPITPKPKSCVALGALRETWAVEKVRNNAERDQMYDLARRSYQQALELDPNYLPAYVALAKLYEKVGDYERCQATY
ncbi:MAG TPA: tetratricopeptide repeat protein, partial [Gemmataceae bacterium]|nr:tetratricopeptide repeat protein [Gemmataceae bacterium]